MNNYIKNLNFLINLDKFNNSQFSNIEHIRMKMTMRVCLISALFGIIFSSVLITLTLYREALICISQPISYFIIAWIVYKGKFEIAKILHTITANFGIFTFASFCGIDSGVHLYILLGPTFILSLYDLSRKKEIIFSILIYLFTFFLYIKFPNNSLFPKVDSSILNKDTSFILYSINIVFIVILSTLLMNYVLRLNTNFIIEILKKNKSLNEKEKSLQDEIEQRKISEKRLRKLFSELQLAYERVNHFSQMVSHNLRSPIANLKGIVTILNETENTEEEKKEYLNAIFVAAHKLDNVIIDMNEILSIQKDLTEKNKIVAFEDELNSILISEKNTFEGKNIKILADFEEIPKIQSVNSFIHSILHNLITNAIKYRKPNTECIIKITTYTKDEFVFLSVEDNGLGIDLNKNNNKIFKPYKRFHSHVEGRGLGLYLVQTQAQMLGGDVSIESELNIGTKFIVNLGKKDI
jgi:signal transduction histidine kinase